jgi:hypothetical protein
MGKIAKFVAFSLYWREKRLFPVSPKISIVGIESRVPVAQIYAGK